MTAVQPKTAITFSFLRIKKVKVKSLLFNVGSSFSYETGINGSRRCARSDWLLSGHYFLVMTGHYETSLGSFELRVKATSAWAKTTKKMVKRWYNYIFNN